jgi:hypothetical protein
MKKLPIAFTLVAALALSACGKDEKTPYAGAPDKPLIDIDTGTGNDDDSGADDGSGTDDSGSRDRPRPDNPPIPRDRPTKFCRKDASGNYPDALDVSSGETNDYIWARGGGCLHRNIKDVWAAALNQSLMDWNDVDEHRSSRLTAPANVSHYYSAHYEVHNIITVRWDMDWYHSVQRGSLQAPERILVNYKKVNGTSYISYWEGNFILEKVNDEVTSFAMANQINASRNNEEDTRGAVRDVYNKLRSGAPDRSQLP